MAQEAKRRHGTSTEPAGSPVKLDKETSTPSDPPAISLDLSEHLKVASGILISATVFKRGTRTDPANYSSLDTLSGHNQKRCISI